MSKKALIITSKLVQDHEFIYPFYRLKEENFEVHTLNGDTKQVTGYFGTKIPPKDEDKIVQIKEVNRVPEKVYMPEHPQANEEGFIFNAAVNVEEELVEMLEASRQYQNNIEVVSTLRNLMMRTINMGK